MSYTYKIRKDRSGEAYIEITGYEGVAKHLDIPGTIEQLPVRSIADSAFGRRDDLVSVRLPERIGSLGRYAFYNCRNLTTIYLYDSVEDYYDGVIRQCAGLSEIHLRIQRDNYAVMKNMLADNDRRLRFFIEPAGVQLTFPAYVYDFVEDVEARVLHHKIEGSGYPYRECVTRKGIDFLAYDRLFAQVISDDYEAAIEIAFDRLMHPYELEQHAGELYEHYLEKMADVVLAQLISSGRMEELGYLCDACLIPEDALENALYEAAQQKKSAVSAVLMEYQRMHFTERRQVQELSLDDW